MVERPGCRWSPRLRSAGLAFSLVWSLTAEGNPADHFPARRVAGPQEGNVSYNGDFTFTRIRYGAGSLRGWGRGQQSWAHDYPAADRNIEVILDELTSMNPNTRGSNVLDLEDPEIFQHPVLYLSEPGFWGITGEGARNLREHLLKGGFIIFDDFDGYGHWENWEAQIRRALPEYRPIEIDQTHPIFDSFFWVEDIYVPHPMVAVSPTYYGIFEDNDPSRRMLALVNYNADLAEYWEWSAQGYFPVDPTNDAYRLGVNYIIYGVTH